MVTRTKNFIASKLHHYFRIDAHYFLSGGFWSFLGQAMGIIVGLVISVLFAQLLSESDFGTYKYILSVAAIISTFSLTGLGQSILQTSAQKYFAFYREALRISIAYNTATFFIGLAGSLYYYVAGNIMLSTGCILIAFFQPIINTFQYTQSFLYGSKKFKEASKVQVIKIFFTSASSICAVILTQNVLILVGTYLISNALIQFILYKIYLPKNTVATPIEITQKYISYAKHTSIRNIATEIAFRLDNIIVFQYLGASELAVYTIANLIPEQIKGSFKTIASLLLPKYAERGDTANTQKNIIKRSFQLFIFSCVITGGYIIIAPYIVEFLFPKYQASIFYTQVIALSFPAMIGVIPLTHLYAKLNEAKLYKLNLGVAIASIIFTFIFITKLGLIGAIIAKLLTRYVNSIFSFFLMRK